MADSNTGTVVDLKDPLNVGTLVHEGIDVSKFKGADTSLLPGGKAPKVEEPKPSEPVEPIKPAEPVAPAEPTPATPESESVVDPLEETRSRLNEVIGKVLDKMSEGTPTMTPRVEPEPQEKDPVTTKLFAENFFDDAELGDLTPKNFSGMFNKALGSYTQRVTNSVVKEVLNQVGSTINKMVNDVVDTNTAVKAFFETNKDLIPYSNYVVYKAKELKQSNPKLSIAELIAKVEDVVRTELAVRKGTTTTAKANTARPNPTPNTTRIPAAPDARSDLQKDLDSISAINVA